MFGMGFAEILIIAVIAIIALGPEKLPSAMVDIAKFFKKFKSGIEDAKTTLDNELHLADMKEQAGKFKEQIDGARDLTSLDNLDKLVGDDIKDAKETVENEVKEVEKTVKREKVSFKDKQKKSEENA